MNTRIRSVHISERGQLVIPEEIRNDMGLKGKETLVLIERGNELILKKESDVAKDITATKKVEEKMSSALLSEKSLAKDWLTKEEDEAWANL